MNSGFSNLASLKAYTLAVGVRARTDWDAALTIIGQGVARAFEKYCDRKFAYTVGQLDVFGADRCQFLLSRFPVVPPVTTVEFKQDEPTGWVVQTGATGMAIQSLDADAGIVYFPDGVDCGAYFSQMRFTYTGGYFWEQLEPVDQGFPTALPAGATALPPDLLLAWYMQCAEIWKLKDKLGQGITVEEKAQRISVANLEDNLLPQVKSILGQYVRFSLT